MTEKFMKESRRHTVVIGNWKMHKTIAEAKSYVSALALFSNHCRVHIGLAVPFTMILTAAEVARGSPISIGAQNVSPFDNGPFTGEISSQMLKDAGASFVILGHSERRRLFLEDDEVINKKLKKVLAEGMRAVVCVGETLSERESGKTEIVLLRQLEGCFQGIKKEQMSDVIIAYEPVWAIGTGVVATIDIVKTVHRLCRQVIARQFGESIAEAIVIQYGGSVNPENAVDLLASQDVDGFLVGTSSLSLESFCEILKNSSA